MSEKNLSIISYLTIIGWGFAYFHFSRSSKTGLLQYHLRQSLGLIVLDSAFCILLALLTFISISLVTILSWSGLLLLFILLVMGIINALNDTRRPVPLIGKFFENRFSFIQ